MSQFKAPIPGQSLTMEPGNQPWEQPPKYAEPEKALAFYMDRFEDPEVLDEAMFLLEQGFPLSVFVESMLTTGVMEGLHTIDVSILVGPVIHEYLQTMASALDINVKEHPGPTNEERQKMNEKRRIALAISSQLSSKQPAPKGPVFEGEPPAPVPPKEEETKSAGFINRRM